MRRALLTLLVCVACAPTRTPESNGTGPTEQVNGAPDRDAPQPLECNATEPCRPLPEEIAAECAKPNQTVTVGTCGALKLLVTQTDPESVTYTSEKRYYDASDKLVAIQVFVNEYGRTVTLGAMPHCTPAADTPACPPK